MIGILLINGQPDQKAFKSIMKTFEIRTSQIGNVAQRRISSQRLLREYRVHLAVTLFQRVDWKRFQTPASVFIAKKMMKTPQILVLCFPPFLKVLRETTAQDAERGLPWSIKITLTKVFLLAVRLSQVADGRRVWIKLNFV
jgi:hypothetical protein